MNEQDKVIYEWLYEELKGKVWELRQTFFGLDALPANAEELGFLPYIPIRKCPPLDMNTAFGECIPKLYDARCTITFTRSGVDYGYLSGSWRIMWGDDAGRMHGAVNPDFYAALLDYIKGVQP